MWGVWMILMATSAYAWSYEWPVCAIALLVVVASTVVAVFLSVTRRAWLVILSRDATLADKRAALRIVWTWRRCAREIYDLTRDKQTGTLWCPGLHGLTFDADDGLILTVQLPSVYLPRSCWERPATDGSMAEILSVHAVQQPVRDGRRVTYVVVPVDVTQDVRHADA